MSNNSAHGVSRGDRSSDAETAGPPRVHSRIGNTAPSPDLQSPRVAALLANLPTRVPRDAAAALVTRHFFRVSKRSLERWPVSVRRLNGRAHVETAELFDVAQKMLDQAPPIRSGRRIAIACAAPDHSC
jgi:hypothetical protein